VKRNLQARAFYNDTDDVDQYCGNSCERFHDSTSRKSWLLQGKEAVEVRLIDEQYCPGTLTALGVSTVSSFAISLQKR
jgi:hypothetical protein